MEVKLRTALGKTGYSPLMNARVSWPGHRAEGTLNPVSKLRGEEQRPQLWDSADGISNASFTISQC